MAAGRHRLGTGPAEEGTAAEHDATPATDLDLLNLNLDGGRLDRRLGLNLDLEGALGQGRGVAAAVEAIARNPSAAGEIRGNLILGLVLIESLVIYVLLISLILFFLPPFGSLVAK